MAQKPVIHGRDHKGRDPAGGPGGADPSVLNVDATANVGTDQGVKSYAASSGDALLSDGSGGSYWNAVGGGGGGIQFDTEPQSGGWLLVETTTPRYVDFSATYGQTFIDNSTGGIALITNDSTLYEDAGITMLVDPSSPGNYRGGWYLKTDPNDNTHVLNFGFATSYYWKLQDAGAYSFAIQDHLSNSLFEVREDGTIHGPTGGSITWDL